MAATDWNDDIGKRAIAEAGMAGNKDRARREREENVEITVTLAREDYEDLVALADREIRTPELQARYLLRRSLGVERSMAASMPAQPSKPSEQDDASDPDSAGAQQ